MYAVEPMSPSPENPSNNPRTPSTTQTSEPLDANPARLRMVSSSIRKESRFLDGLPVAAEWYIGSMKSGPALNAWTSIVFDRRDISPVAIDVFPTPLPVPARTNPFKASPSGCPPSPAV